MSTVLITGAGRGIGLKLVEALLPSLRRSAHPVVCMRPGWVRTDMGGPEAPVEAEDSARGMIEVIGEPGPEHAVRPPFSTAC